MAHSQFSGRQFLLNISESCAYQVLAGQHMDERLPYNVHFSFMGSIKREELQMVVHIT